MQLAVSPYSTFHKWPLKAHTHSPTTTTSNQRMDDLLQRVQKLFEQHLILDSLLSLSHALQAELKHHLISSPQCMLPSFNYTLPTGQEQGTYLALEVGGSNLRMSLVKLRGRDLGSESMQIRQTASFPITAAVRQMREYVFFDWMAARIGDMLALENDVKFSVVEPLHMGVAWSFPIEQTSLRSGQILAMGKGFRCSETVKGRDLGDMITQACQRAKLDVRLDAIVNDSSSALLARAYADPATRLAIILGTGMNAAIHLPITSLGHSKFSSRSLPKGAAITHVLTNTELSMFGKNILPTTPWDEILNADHNLPNYQPFEYLIAGGYISEIVRIIIIEATDTAGLFGGSLPPSMQIPYNLDTKTLAQIETDTSAQLTKSRSLLHQRDPLTKSTSFADAYFIQRVVRSVSSRSIAYFAVGVHALSSLFQELEAKSGLQDDLDHICIGCDGSVINKYPGYMEKAQETLDRLVKLEASGRKRVILEKTQESAVLGAGVAGAMAATSPVK